MKHKKAYRHLGRSSGHRRATLRNLVTALFKYGRIETTEAKAKELSPLAEKVITLAKRGDLHARRQALAYLQEKTVAHTLFEEGKSPFLERQGGYVRVMKKGFRKGDGAPVSVVELIGVQKEKKTPKRDKKAPRQTKAEGKTADKPKSRGGGEESPARTPEKVDS
jgi:large subunit ribosomal protein L17